MMKYLILSDVHSNIHALNKIIDNEKYDQMLFLGDVIGYGGDPQLCYKKFLEAGGTGVLGNHEYGVIKPFTLINFSENARLGVLHSIKKLPKEYVDHMKQLPETLQRDDFILCHSMLEHPLEFQYVFPEDKDSDYLRSSFRRMKELGVKVMFTGHTHKPCIFKQKSDETIEMYKSMDGDIFLDENLFIINAGSVGQSRNNVPKAHYVIYDTAKRRVTFKSVDYNIADAADRIHEEGLPDFLAQRLYLGI